MTDQVSFENNHHLGVISTLNAPHFVWGDGCDGWWLKQNGAFTVIYEIMPAGCAEIKHYHQITEQFFYCLQGSLVIELEGEKVLSEQEGYCIEAGIPHQVKNVSNKPVHFMVISSPNSHNDRINLDAS